MTGEPFTEFVLAHGHRLHRTAVLLTRDPHAAHDLLQESLLKAWRAWGRVTDNPEAYVRTILLREFLTARRRRWHGEVPTETLPETAPEHGLDTAAELDLARAVGDLPAQQRAVVVLRYFHDLTVADTARTMGISEGTVKSHHSRALAALRISEHLDDDVVSEGREQR
ncbi:SigE family RNA polymerase sigma factor [Serinicoccus kebangsaanensis]|uniref:SigE family RNA polymerase sigma factor n=1 Tax=Serinicoccus kebangsaanensis TaxID=2602069 RepID=UPI00124CFA23|nr:SigE family RNA polymerase sigma factor [Serinicoccus kebangsaanensis]